MEGPILEIAKKMQKRGFRVLAVCGNKGWARLGNGWQQVKMIPKGNEYSGYYDAVIE
jgi:hypothetical protein